MSLVTLALATDEGGFPRRSSVLPGNVSEPGTLLDALDSLVTEDEGENKPTVIMDAGIATEDNLAALRERDFHWITVKRGGVKPDQVEAMKTQDPDATFETKSGHEVRAWKLSRDHENEAQLCIWSQARQEKDEAILAKKRKSFEADLADLHKGLSKPRCTKKYEKILERLGRLKERYALVNHHYDITVTKAPDGKARAVTWKRNAAYDARDARTGHYVLRTSHTEWSAEDTVRTYWRLTELEATFRSLKSELGLRPIWHQLSKRIEGHLFIAVLALYGVNVIRTRLAAHGIHYKWATLRHKLGRWQRATTAMTTTGGSRIEVRCDIRPDPARISDKDTDELQLYAHSGGRRQTEASILARQRSKLEAELQYLHDGLSLPRRMKRHDRVLEKIGRLKERYSRVASQYMIRIERTDDTATAVRFKRQDKADLADAAAGSCVLRTSHTDWDAEKILRTYWRLTDLENTFRQLKSELGLRPIWHSTDARISAHLFITVLAYHAVHLIRTRLRDNDINLRWDSIRNRMASWERITTTQQTPTGQQVVVRQDARPSDEAATIARHVNVHVGAYRQRL